MQGKMNRQLVKSQIKEEIIQNKESIMKGTITIGVIALLMVISILLVNPNQSATDNNNFASNSSSYLSTIFVSPILFLGIKRIDIPGYLKNLEFRDAFTWLDDFKDFIDLILLTLLMSVFIFLWTLLFIVPGIIKGFSYSQAVAIFFDAKRQGISMGYRDALKESSRIMQGNKWDFFVIQISFIGYFILFGLIILIGTVISIFGGFGKLIGLPILLIAAAIYWFTMVYQQFTNAAFYRFLVPQHWGTHLQEGVFNKEVRNVEIPSDDNYQDYIFK